MKLKLIFAIILAIILISLLIGCKKTPVEEQPAQIIEEQEKIEEELPEPEIVEVILTIDRKMVPSQINITVGTTVKWINQGETPRNLMIYDGSINDLREENVIRSQNFYSGESFSYTFTEKKTYTIRDVYTGSMRGEITAEAVNILGDQEIGKINVHE